jgi:hypothetical protein
MLFSDFSENSNISTDFRKIPQFQTPRKIRVVGAKLFRHKDGQTDVTKLIVTFNVFENAPKNSTFCPHSVFMYLCVLYLSQRTVVISLHNNGWFLKPRMSMFIARYELGLYI